MQGFQWTGRQECYCRFLKARFAKELCLGMEIHLIFFKCNKLGTTWFWDVENPCRKMPKALKTDERSDQCFVKVQAWHHSEPGPEAATGRDKNQ